LGHSHRAEPSSHLPFQTVTGARERFGSRLAARPSALQSRPSRQSLLWRRSTSVGTVVRAKTVEHRAVWRCRSPQRKDALVSDFAVCARSLDRCSKRWSAWKSAPSGGAVRKAPGSAGFRGTKAPRIPASPWAPTSRLCASESVALLGKSSAAVVRLRGPRVGLKLCAAPQRRALPGTSSGRGPIGPLFQTRRRECVESGDRRAPSLRPETEQAVARARLVDSGEPKCQSELPHCKQQGWRKGRGFFSPARVVETEAKTPPSSPKTRRWVRARGKGPDAVT
jgi:hypothetical protein